MIAKVCYSNRTSLLSKFCKFYCFKHFCLFCFVNFTVTVTFFDSFSIKEHSFYAAPAHKGNTFKSLCARYDLVRIENAFCDSDSKPWEVVEKCWYGQLVALFRVSNKEGVAFEGALVRYLEDVGKCNTRTGKPLAPHPAFPCGHRYMELQQRNVARKNEPPNITQWYDVIKLSSVIRVGDDFLPIPYAVEVYPNKKDRKTAERGGWKKRRLLIIDLW